MNWFVWIVLGLVSGMLAKLFMPGKDGGGFLFTTGLGIAGAIVGGWIGKFIPFIKQVSGFNIASIFTSVVGALVVLAIYNYFTRNN